MSKAFGALGTAISAPISAMGKLAGALSTGLGVAAGFQVFNSVASAIGSAGSAAITFEQSMSGVKAVSGATVPEMKSLTGLALELGKNTVYSAGQAATGIQELIKGGVSIGDVLGGTATAALNLAAAGSISVGDAATIAATAMSQFGLSGADMENVVNKIAGAANASTLEVSDFKLSLNQVGAVAHLAGQSFDDTATAIAVMGAAGIKGSDAGTSLKTMLLNLQPQTARQSDEFKRLGLITASGANAFFDATGKAKGMADVSQVLQNALKGMTQQQKLASLELLFGSDAIRAGAILSEAGAAGFDKMAGAMGKVTAASVAMERLNNVAGDIEQLKGSLETAAIVLVGTFAPAFRPAIQAATELTNRFIQEAQTIIKTAENIAGAHGIGMIPAALTAVELRIGEVFGPQAQGAFHAVRSAIEQVITTFGNVVQEGRALAVMAQNIAGAHGLGLIPAALTAVELRIGEVFGPQAQGVFHAMRAAVETVGEAFSTIGGALQTAVDWLTKTKDGTAFLGAAIGTATGLLAIWATTWGIAQVAMAGTTLVTGAMTAAQWLLNAALTANPIGIVVVALAALAGALIAAYKTNEDFRNKVDAAWAWLKEAAGQLKDAIGAALDAIAPHWATLVASNDHNAAVFRKTWDDLVASHDRSSQSIQTAMARLDPVWSAAVAANDHNATLFRKAWDDLVASHDRSTTAIQTAMAKLEPTWARAASEAEFNAYRMKLAWDLVASVASGNGETIKRAWEAMAGATRESFRAFQDSMKPVAPAAQQMADDVAGAAADAASGVERGTGAMSTALDTLPPAAADAASGVASAMGQVPAAVEAQAAPAASAASAVGFGISDALATGVDPAPVATATTGAVDSAVAQGAAQAEAGAPAVGSAVSVGMAAGVTSDGVSAAASAAVATATGAAAGTAGETAPAVGAAIDAGMAAGVTSDGVSAAASGAVTTATASAQGTAAAQSPSIGASIAQGMVAGIRTGLPWVVSAAVNLAIAAKNAAQAALDGHSPSRVFEDIGETIPEGLVVGVESGSDDLIGAVEAMLSAAQTTAEDGTAAFVDTFASLGDLIGAQYERAYTIVEAAQMKAQQALEDEEGNFQRTQDADARKHERRMADLQEAAGRATVEQRKGINEKIAQEQENYQRRLEDSASAHQDKLIDLQLNGEDAVRASQQKQALAMGAALKDFQRGVEDLERDVTDHVAAIHQKAFEARSEAIKTAEDAIDEANRKTEEGIRELLQSRGDALTLRGRRDVFSVGQDTASRVFSQGREDTDLITRQQEQLADRKKQLEENAADLSRSRSREDADAEYQLERDLQDAKTDEDKAQIRARYDRARQDLDRRRRLDDDERDRKAKADAKALDDSFKKALVDLAKRRIAEQQERDFRADQEKERQRFEDGLADEALAKQIRRLEDERVKTIRNIDDTLQDKLKKINDSERKEQDALKKSSDQKLQDLKERFLDKVGPLTGDALSAFERLFNGIRDRVRDAAGAVDEFAQAMARIAGAQVKASMGPTFKAADNQTFGGQSQQAQSAFRAQYGADAERQWTIQHNQEIGLPDAPVRATQNAFGDTSGSLAELGLSPSGNIGAQAMALAAASGGSVTIKEPGMQPVTYGLGGSQEALDTLLGQPEVSVPEEFRAAGGSVTAGRRYTVGEHGPEPFIPWADGMIAPHGADLSGGWGGNSGAGMDYDALATAIASKLGAQTIVMDGQTVGRVIRTELLKYKQRNGSTGLG